MHPTALNPVSVHLVWAIVLACVGWANFRSVTEAWAQASALHPKKNLRFFASFLAREQIAYAKRIPRLLCISVMLLGIVLIVPWA